MPHRLPLLLVLLLAVLLPLGCREAETAQADDAPPAAADLPDCDADDGSLVLPDGFCALVVADDLGPVRHLAVDDDGDVYAALRQPTDGGGLVALRDTDGDGRMDLTRRFGERGGTGIGLREGFLYFAPDDEVWRYPLAQGALVPEAEPEVVVTGFPDQGSHAAKPFTFDEAGGLYVTVGAPSNACQQQTRTKGSPGMDPCPDLERQGGIWRFEADALGQTQQADGERFATGIRHAVALDYDPAGGALYAVQHGRDQLHMLWPEHYTREQGSELPSEEFIRIDRGDDFGWPFCYHDPIEGVKELAPEYGGDGQTVGRCADFEDPLVAFPGHWAPNDLLFYHADQFPTRYRGGAFVAFHGSWNRSPRQAGYQVAFTPFEQGAPAGTYETFADGFAGEGDWRPESPGEAEYRPMGLATGPDGSLYVSDSRQGRIWRIVYTGG